MRLLARTLLSLAAVLAAGNCCASTILGHGIVNVSAASLRNSPSHASELETQAVYGTPVEVVREDDGWLLVVTPDGYRAYAHPSAIEMKSEPEMVRWRSAPRLIVTSLRPVVIVADTLDCGPRNIVSDATLCSVFEGSLKPGAEFVGVTLPDGRKGFMPSTSVDDFERWMSRDFSADQLLDVAWSMMGVPYLWGGSTPKGIDCSGLTQLSYFYCGILLPRNASQQAMIGEELDITQPDGFRRSDLLFFGEGDDVKITHVGVSDGGSRFVHASGRVFVSSFDPSDPLFIPRRLLKAVRINPVSAGEGTIRVCDHEWYFNLSENLR